MSGSWVDIDHENRPVPARLAEPAELDALCATLGQYRGILQIVPEFYMADLLCARIDLLADLSRKHDIYTTFSPLFDSNASPELVGIALDRVRLQSAHGARVVPQMQTRPIDLSFDLTAPMSTFATLPGWWAMTLLAADEKRALLRDPEQRRKLAVEMDDFMMPIGLKIDFADAYVKRMGRPDPALMGRRVGDIAASRGCHVAEAIIALSLADDSPSTSPVAAADASEPVSSDCDSPEDVDQSLSPSPAAHTLHMSSVFQRLGAAEPVLTNWNGEFKA